MNTTAGPSPSPRASQRQHEHQIASIILTENAAIMFIVNAGQQPVRLNEWIATIRDRYAFIARLDADEQRWAQCNERDLHEVETALASFPAHT